MCVPAQSPNEIPLSNVCVSLGEILKADNRLISSLVLNYRSISISLERNAVKNISIHEALSCQTLEFIFVNVTSFPVAGCVLPSNRRSQR